MKRTVNTAYLGRTAAISPLARAGALAVPGRTYLLSTLLANC
jgi:hypothetical protein